MTTGSRKANEIEHGKLLSQLNTEKVWGWSTPAGLLRSERRANLISENAHIDANKKVLEIGCGTGYFTEKFAHSGARIIAVDISPDLLARARERGLPEAQVEFLAKPFEDCDVDGPFDAVIGSSVLHHLDVEWSLSKIFNLLKPGGYLSFAEPNLLNPQVFLERKLSFIKPLFWYVSPDEIAFIRWSLTKQLNSTGFIDVTIQPFDWLAPYTPTPLIGIVQGLGGVLEKTPLFREFSGSLIISARKPN
jgi:2-polyprenyl-3-methyl-5-hydroxy-6-metoxy-1,4-benzoquinol methylase